MLPPSFFTGKLPMIHCLLIKITQNPRGQAERQEREISFDRLTLGRGADCKIHLADHRVALHHASIQQGDNGKLYISAEPSRTIEVDGHLEEVAALTSGMRIMIGPYALTVEALEGNERITLSYELMNKLPDSIQPKLATSLFATGLSMRKPAMWLAAIITLIFIVLPISYTLSPWLHKTAQSIHLPMNVPLNAGHMSPGHLALSTKCDTCHQKPFMAVSDKACESCHKSVSHHIAQSALHAKVFKNVRCTTCHMDHRGQKGLIRKDSPQCVSCHGNIKNIYGDSKLNNIHDFSSDHPAFKLSFKAGPDGLTTRVAQNEKSKLVEHSGLKFSHEEHFDKALIQTPSGHSRDIDCADCHIPNDAGTGFKPMTMPLTCQQSKCHSLQLTPPIEGRVVPHASEKVVMTYLREMFASRAINEADKNGLNANALEKVRQSAQAQTNSNAKALFTKEGEGTCLECHEITANPKNKETPWKVASVHVTEHWLPKSRFPHDKHSTAKCSSCHDVMHSDKSSDIAMPTIAKCRECHVGSKQAQTLVSSTCNTCHSFHDVKAKPTHKVAKAE